MDILSYLLGKQSAGGGGGGGGDVDKYGLLTADSAGAILYTYGSDIVFCSDNACTNVIHSAAPGSEVYCKVNASWSDYFYIRNRTANTYIQQNTSTTAGQVFPFTMPAGVVIAKAGSR